MVAYEPEVAKVKGMHNTMHNPNKIQHHTPGDLVSGNLNLDIRQQFLPNNLAVSG